MEAGRVNELGLAGRMSRGAGLDRLAPTWAAEGGVGGLCEFDTQRASRFPDVVLDALANARVQWRQVNSGSMADDDKECKLNGKACLEINRTALWEVVESSRCFWILE